MVGLGVLDIVYFTLHSLFECIGEWIVSYAVVSGAYGDIGLYKLMAYDDGFLLPWICSVFATNRGVR